jgi:hypothetical protein
MSACPLSQAGVVPDWHWQAAQAGRRLQGPVNKAQIERINALLEVSGVCTHVLSNYAVACIV